MTFLLLAEKPSAAQNFAKALGGMSGSYNGQPYKIQALFGHMMEFAEPHEMVGDDVQLQELFKSWTPNTMPWDVSKMNWLKKPQVVRNMRTGKMSSKAGAIQDVKKAAKGCSAIVIATDKDPSGEGQLIGWEVIQAIGWTGDVKRMYFIDESEKALRNGFAAIQDLPSYDKDGEYVKADVRSRWDFISMQLTRLSTHEARRKGYNVVVRQGRLKSVMTKLVADQLALVKAYKKKPYFEVKYKDDKGNMYARKFNEDDAWRFAKKEDAEQDMLAYQSSNVVQDSKERKETAPGKLLDLGGLAAILGSRGYKSKEVLATYQKMYEAKIVSYPRTEDKFISHEQFNELLPLVDAIANVVGADVSLLTHRSPRKTHVKDGGAHGANRPGVVVPSSLSSLSSYGASAEAIYTVLAKNFLAMFGENYVYDSVKGHIAKHPAFTTTVSIPVSMGFKAIFDADAEVADEQSTEQVSSGLGTTGSPVIAEGVNKKPPHPTHKWLEKQLSKYDVGTGATRVSTLSDVTNGKTALLTDTKGKLNLTRTGEIAAVLLDGSQIGDPSVTESLFKSMKEVGAFTVSPDEVLAMATRLVAHDKEVFARNAETLAAKVGAPSGDEATAPTKEKHEGVYAPTGETVRFNTTWGGYTFSSDELARLLAGESLTIVVTTPKGSRSVEGSLGKGEFKGRSFWGFQRKESDAYTAKDAPFPASWSSYTFTKEDEAKLRSGKRVRIKAVSKAGKPFEVDVSFELREYKGSRFWGIVPHFENDPNKVNASEQTRETCTFKAEFSGYKLTEQEIKELRAGHKVMVTAKSKSKGKMYTCLLSLELRTYNGSKFWGLVPHFD